TRRRATRAFCSSAPSTAATASALYTLSLHDALPILVTNTVAIGAKIGPGASVGPFTYLRPGTVLGPRAKAGAHVEMKNAWIGERSEEHTSELQSRENLVFRRLLEKKKSYAREGAEAQ